MEEGGCRSFGPWGSVTPVEGTLIQKLAYDPGSQSLGLGTIKRELSRRLGSPGLRIQFSREQTGLEPLENLSVTEVSPER